MTGDRAAGGAAAPVAAVGTRPAPGGPWDESEVDGLGRRVDLGAIWLPGVVGMELRMEIDKKTNQVTGVGVTLAGSALQVQAFAAPRTEGIWDEIRAEIAESVTKQGGSVDDLPGPFGRELLARLPVRTPEGRTGHRPARFIGHDGPRWFLRGVLTGAAAVDPQQAAQLEALFADIVVVRGTEARAPRDLLALRLPGPGPHGAGPAGRRRPARARPPDPGAGDHRDPIGSHVMSKLDMKGALHRAFASQAELEADEERIESIRYGCTPVSGLPERRRATVHGVIRSVTLRPRQGVPGARGRAVRRHRDARPRLAGPPRDQRHRAGPPRAASRDWCAAVDGRRTVYNPRYELLPRHGE